MESCKYKSIFLLRMKGDLSFTLHATGTSLSDLISFPKDIIARFQPRSNMTDSSRSILLRQLQYRWSVQNI